MYVTKRDNTTEEVSYDKITNRLKKLMWEIDINSIDLLKVTKKIINGMYNNILTEELDELSSQICANLITEHPNYGILASRICISNLHKKTKKKFSQVIDELYNYVNEKTNEKGSLISKELYRIVMNNRKKINSAILYDRDYNYDYFGFKTLEKAYLLKINRKIIERPQHMLMRVSIGIHGKDLDKAIETYNLMSQKYFTHATPTLFNSGTPRPQLSSCFLLQMQEDSIEGIYETLKQTAKISKNAGGIGLAIHKIRSNGSYIKGTNGYSNGTIPMLRVFNNTARYVDQCITPETILYTKNGIKEIKKLKINDEIVTNDGSFQKVKKIMHYNKKEKMYNMKLLNSIYDINATEYHPFLCITNQKKGLNYNVIKNRLEKNIIKPEWVEIKDITTDDLIGFPIPTYEEDILEYTLDDCFMYGILIGDGYICKNSKSSGICLNNTTKIELVNFVKNYLSKKLIHYTETINDKIVKLRWTLTNEFPFTRDMLYDDNDEKIIMENMLHLPKNKILNIIKGLLLTDGCYYKEITLELNSKQVIESIRYMLLRCGILTSGYKRDRVGETHEIRKDEYITTQKKTYVLRIPKKKLITDIYNIEEGNLFKFIEYNNTLYSRVSEITTYDYNGLVYDLEIENNHNYLTHSGLVHNGGGKRKGSFAMYLEPWHNDIFSFLELRKNHGNEEERCRDLFLGLWIPDLFMKQVKENKEWYLMCPNECPGLDKCHSKEFEDLYLNYVSKNKYTQKIQARKLWNAILDSQIETGTPYMLYKDACNSKSNQQNLGTIQSSNLCTEIIEYTSPEECAVCLVGDTKILTKNGYINLKDYNDEELVVPLDNDKNNIVKYSNLKGKLINNGIKDVYEISFNNKYIQNKIIATENHKFIKYINTKYDKYNNKNDILEWVELKNLKVGDKLYYPEFETLEKYKNCKVNEEALAIGWLIGDGWISKRENNDRCSIGVCFGNNDTYAKDKIVNILLKLYNNLENSKYSNFTKTKKCYLDKNGVYIWQTSKKSFIEYILKKYDLKITKASSKGINDCIKKMGGDIILSLLSGLFSADGCIHKKTKTPEISLTSVSKKLLNDIYWLLLEIGIKSTIRGFTPKDKNWQGILTINGEENLRKYQKYIGFKATPWKEDLLKERLDNFIWKRKQRNRFYQVIKEIKYIGKKQVYDIALPEKHNFIAENIISHNCNLASIGLSMFVKKSNKLDDKKITVYGKTECKYCNYTKKYLNNLNIDYEYISLDDDIKRKNFFNNLNKNSDNNVKTVPQIFIDDERIGGYTDLLNYDKPFFDFELLGKITRVITRNLDTIIDVNYYPIKEAKNSNMKHRPIGIGVQGLADTFHKLKYPFESDEAKLLNKKIFATIYYYALLESNKLAIEKGKYSTFENSPASKGFLQFDLWKQEPDSMYNWQELKKNIQNNGLRNSLLLAPMPTASTSQILGNNECFEPYTTNIYIRRTLAGEFICINKFLLDDLINLNLWNNDLKNEIIKYDGSIQNINNIPKNLKEQYKTVWEISQKNILDMAADRGIYIDQSQSLNIYMDNITINKLTSMHFYGWKKGLKTGMYYLRSKPATNAIKFTIENKKNNINNNEEEEECLMCSG